MQVRLNDSAIGKAIREAPEMGRKDLSDVGCPGLRLRVTPAGTASWVLACRDRHGRMRRFPLGRYPAVGVSDARNAARSLREKVQRDGSDPIAERRAERARAAEARAGVGTLGALLDLYGQKVGAKQKAWIESRKRIELVLRPLLNRPVEELTVGQMQAQVDSYPSAKSAAFVVRSVRPAIKWAVAPGRRYAPAELTQISPPAEGAVERRKRVLSRAELAKLLPVLRTSNKAYASALNFMLLTLSRRQETASAHWRDVDFERRTWTLRETKNDEPHVIPLSRQAIELLRSRLPKDADAEQTPDPAGLIFTTSTGAALGNWDRETKALLVASGLAEVDTKTGDVSMKDGSPLPTRHDLRRTGATMLGEMGELPDILEAALNHVSIRSRLAATYNRSRYRPQVAAALQRLADALDGLESGAGEIVPLRSGEVGR